MNGQCFNDSIIVQPTWITKPTTNPYEDEPLLPTNIPNQSFIHKPTAIPILFLVLFLIK
jgi:hypothetical protein